MKRFLLLIIGMMICISLSGCNNGTEPKSDKSYETVDDTITIGMCFDSFVIERWEKDRDVFVSTASKLGAEVNVQNANGEVMHQIEQIEYFIEKNVDAIVIICIDPVAIEDAVKKAKDKGIYVIAYDRMINNADVDLYVSFNNEMVGELMAKALASSIKPDDSVIMFEGPTTDNNVALVNKGFTSVCENLGINIVNSMNCEGWRAEDASEYLYDNPDALDGVAGIMCGNDNVATQVVRVLSERRMAGDLALVGQDADLEACQRIVEGTQTMTVYKPVENEAKKAAEATVSLIKGEDIEDLTTVSDGNNSIKAIILEPIAVNAENMDDVIIDSGFHMNDEVYLNIK